MECDSIPRNVKELSLVITNDLEIQELNKFYRKKNKATDVLSFSQIENLSHGLPSRSLGDIVISYDTTIRQARNYKVTINQELLRLLIHGLLHLCGYDHERVSKSVAEKMRRLERKLFSQFEKDFRQDLLD